MRRHVRSDGAPYRELTSPGVRALTARLEPLRRSSRAAGSLWRPRSQRSRCPHRSIPRPDSPPLRARPKICSSSANVQVQLIYLAVDDEAMVAGRHRSFHHGHQNASRDFGEADVATGYEIFVNKENNWERVALMAYSHEADGRRRGLRAGCYPGLCTIAAPTAASSSSSWKGLSTCPRKPAASVRRCSATLAKPETAITGMSVRPCSRWNSCRNS